MDTIQTGTNNAPLHIGYFYIEAWGIGLNCAVRQHDASPDAIRSPRKEDKRAVYLPK
jgi:hypothetical protein